MPSAPSDASQPTDFRWWRQPSGFTSSIVMLDLDLLRVGQSGHFADVFPLETPVVDFRTPVYLDCLKETYLNMKQFDIFIFTDNRTELRTETSQAGKEYQRYIVQPLLVSAVDKENKVHIINRDTLIKIFKKHYLSLFYSKFDPLKKDFKVNIITVDATPILKPGSEYANYKCRFKPFDNANPVAMKLVAKFAELEPPVVKKYAPKTTIDFDYGSLQAEDLDCI
jgi:hypothetical protein